MENPQLLPLFNTHTTDYAKDVPEKVKIPPFIPPISASQTDRDFAQTLLNKLFPEQKREDKTIKQARTILGGLIDKFSSEELQEVIILLQYLTETWLDMYEKELFNGKTLNELLNCG